MSNRKNQALTATEFMAQIEADKEYQERKANFDAGVRERASVLREAEKPIVNDLHTAGVEVESVWDLVNSSIPYPAALPVLMSHLERGGYPDRVMDSLGRALAVKPSIKYWDRLRARYLSARSSGEEEGAAVALAACATSAQLDDLVDFLSVAERGQSRIYFLRPIIHIGGQAGRQILESMTADPTFGTEARALLKR